MGTSSSRWSAPDRGRWGAVSVFHTDRDRTASKGPVLPMDRECWRRLRVLDVRTRPESGAVQALTALLTLPGPLLDTQDAVELNVLARLLGVSARDGPLPDAVQLGSALCL